MNNPRWTRPPDRWVVRFMSLAAEVATWSKDRSTKVGAVLVGPDREVLGVGYNGFPPGVDDDNDKLHERPLKYLITAHAEANAVAFAAKNGVRLDGASIYVTMFPCSTCAKLLIRAGVRFVCAPTPTRADWAEEHAAAKSLFEAAGTYVMEVKP